MLTGTTGWMLIRKGKDRQVGLLGSVRDAGYADFVLADRVGAGPGTVTIRKTTV